MKKKFTRFAAVAMAGVMAFALASCGGGHPVKKDTLNLGNAGPLTGGAAIYGNAVDRCGQLAVNEINAANPDGVQLAWKAEDDEADPEKSVNAYNTLMDKGLNIFIGTTTSGAGVAVAEKADADRVFTLTPSASQVAVTEGHDNVFQLCFNDPNQGVAAAQYIMANMKDKKVGIISQQNDYSQGINEKFVSEFKGEIVAQEVFAKDDEKDFTAQLNAMKDAGADLVFVPIYYTPAANILTQANKMGYAPTFFGVDGMDGILTAENFDASLAEGVMLLTPFVASAQEEATQKFVKAYVDAYGEEPNQFAADAYDCVYAVYNAFQQTGLDASASNADICEALIKVFTGGFTASGVTGAEMKWNASGQVDKTPKACVIENGVYVQK